jgi:hypothetical protein
MHARESSGTRARVLLRDDGERFSAIMTLIGYGSDLARARALNVNPSTIYRARHGSVAGVLIARTIAILRRHEAKLAEYNIKPSFDEIFEVDSGRVAA